MASPLIGPNTAGMQFGFTGSQNLSNVYSNPSTAVQSANGSFDGDYEKYLYNLAHGNVDPGLRQNNPYYEKWLNYEMTKAQDKRARDFALEFDSTRYQRLAKDLKAAGISPYVITGATPGAASSVNGSQISSSQITSSENNEKNNLVKLFSLLFGLAALMGK